MIMRRQMTDAAAIEAEIERLQSYVVDELRRHWRMTFGRTSPVCFSKDLLARMIACRLQELAFGGLDRESLAFLDRLAQQAGPRRRLLKAGTVLVREYQGQRHTVTVARDGFDWQGRSYPSLSAIARAITGTAWSGPRFFGLRGGGDQPKRTRGERARHQHKPLKTGAGTPPIATSNPAPTAIPVRNRLGTGVQHAALLERLS
jgi:Protein of unknown function (DUF2924)